MSFTLPTSKLTYYHTFSKLPVEDTLPLGSAINKAGHTVSATEVWTAEIPYFGKMGSTADVTSKVTPYAKTNDMVQITSGADKDKVFRRNEVDKTGKTFNDLWVDVTSEFVDGATFKNANGDEVLIYHKGKKLELLDEGNNANITSKNNASRLWVGEGDNRRLVEQFVGVTDRSLNGLASVAYAPAIKKGNTDQVAGTHYFDYCVSGTILWATANTTDSYITCFEYKGPKVSVSIENLQAAIDAVQGTIENGVVSSISPSPDAKSAGFDIDDSEPTSPIINFTKGEVAADSNALVTGADVWNYITELHSVPQLRIVIVEEPADDWTKTEGLTIEKNTIYLVNDKASDPALSGSYIEYLAYEKKDGTIVTEKIGTTKIDLTGYVNDVQYYGENDLRKTKVEIVDGVLTFSEKSPYKLSTAWMRNDNIVSLIDNVLYSKVEHTDPYDGTTYTTTEKVAVIETDGIDDAGESFKYCNKFAKFKSDLSSLVNGTSMFQADSELNYFEGDLSSLQIANHMFFGCKKLTSFTSDLSSLLSGYYMFFMTPLDIDSLTHIAETINDVNNVKDEYVYINERRYSINKDLTITIGNKTPTDEEMSLLMEIHNKGWNVYAYGSSGSDIVLPTNGATIIPTGEEMPEIIPFYAKPVEVEKERAEYIGEDGKFYIILGGQFIFVKDPETYGMFTSLEDAAANMRLTKIENHTNN